MITTRKGWVWNCAIGAIPQGRDEVLYRENGLPIITEGRNKDAAGVNGKLSWHPYRVCFRSSLHTMWLIAVATVGRHSQGAFWHEIFVTAIKGKTMDYKRKTRSEYKRYGWE